MEVSVTVTNYLNTVVKKKDIIPLLITTNFQNKAAGAIIPVHPLVFVPNSPHYKITENVFHETLEKFPPDEICLVYLGVVFNPNNEDFSKKDPMLIFQIQTKSKVQILAYDFVESDSSDDAYIILSPDPINVSEVTDIETCTLPFIIKNF